jgi:hypothetical protein
MTDRPVTDPRIRIGGVMRCCVDRPQWPTDPTDGDTLVCPHGCSERLVYSAGVWEWYRPDHPLRPREDVR